MVHVAGAVDPLSDIETIETELALADLASLEKRAERLRRSAKGSQEDAETLELTRALITKLAEGVPARLSGLTVPKDFNLLTAKPVIYVCNVAEADAASGNALSEAVAQHASAQGAQAVVISAQLEGELSELDDAEAAEFLQSYGLSEPGLNRLVRSGYEVLGLLTFLTAGEKEVRAWTVPKGSRAPQAAGEIHTDFERGFIRAEVIAWDKLVEAGSLAAAKSKGWVRTEGKEYVVRDGDVMHFLFNV